MFAIAVLAITIFDIKAITATIADPSGYVKISPNGYVSGAGPLQRMYSTTLDACASACSDDSSCYGFDWDVKDYDCQLESVDYNQAVEGGHWTTDEDGDWVFYSKIWESDGYEKISPNGYVSGLGPLQRMYSTTLEACASACSDDSACFGFDWDVKDDDCQLESVDYNQAVEGGHWKTDEDGDWVFYSKIGSSTTSTSTDSTASSTSTSTSTATPSPCLDFCDSTNNTWIGQTCQSIGSRADCRTSFLGNGEVVNACVWLNAFGISVCVPPAASAALACPEAVFSSCSCVSTSGWGNKRCRNNCHFSAQGSFHNKCSQKCSDSCLANARRLESAEQGHSSLRGYQVVV